MTSRMPDIWSYCRVLPPPHPPPPNLIKSNGRECIAITKLLSVTSVSNDGTLFDEQLTHRTALVHRYKQTHNKAVIFLITFHPFLIRLTLLRLFNLSLAHFLTFTLSSNYNNTVSNSIKLLRRQMRKRGHTKKSRSRIYFFRLSSIMLYNRMLFYLKNCLTYFIWHRRFVVARSCPLTRTQHTHTDIHYIYIMLCVCLNRSYKLMPHSHSLSVYVSRVKHNNKIIASFYFSLCFLLLAFCVLLINACFVSSSLFFCLPNFPLTRRRITFASLCVLLDLKRILYDKISLSTVISRKNLFVCNL